MNTQPDLKPIMTVGHVAELLEVEINTVKDYVRAGMLRCAKVGSTWLFTDTELIEDIRQLIKAEAKPPKRSATMAQIPQKRTRPDLSKVVG